MPAYNFMPRFVGLVESGQKRQTIRSSSKGAKPGDFAYLYTGQRTKQCRKLGVGILIEVLPIKIGRDELGELYAHVDPDNITGRARYLTRDGFSAFARADGFQTGEEMAAWFDSVHGLPFTGYLHQWATAATPGAGL